MIDHRGVVLVGLGFLIGFFTFFALGYFGGQNAKINELHGNVSSVMGQDVNIA